MSIITQKVNETGGKINLPRIWRQPCKKMDHGPRGHMQAPVPFICHL